MFTGLADPYTDDSHVLDIAKVLVVLDAPLVRRLRDNRGMDLAAPRAGRILYRVSKHLRWLHCIITIVRSYRIPDLVRLQQQEGQKKRRKWDQEVWMSCC